MSYGRTSRLGAVLAAVALFAVPLTATADASRKTEKRQNTAIKRLRKTDKKQNKSIGSLAAVVSDLKASTPKLLKPVTDAVAQLTAGLQGAEAKLQTLGSSYQATEVGRAALSPGDADLTIDAGGAGTSADIPDDGNAITVDDDAVIVAGAGATTETLTLRALIRSAESDGDSAAKTAGQAGGFLQLSNADTGARVACTGAPNPPGILTTTPGDPIVTPTGTKTNLPLKNIPGGHSRTDTTEPTGSNGTALLFAPCSFTATPGTTYRAHWSVQFVDMPTSATPGPTE